MTTNPTYIIAEAGVNHNGNKQFAFDLIDVAASSGANAVKFQTFNAEKLAAANLNKAAYQQNNTHESGSQLAMLKQLELPQEWHDELKQYCLEQGIDFLSTAFDLESLAFLAEMDLPFYKIPSGEVINAPLLWHYAQLKKPLILSTGMCSLAEVEQALAVIAYGLTYQQYPDSSAEIMQCYASVEGQQLLKRYVSLLHCTSQYPTPMSDVNLLAMQTLASAFSLPVGYSDHTVDNTVAIAAVAMGASIVEKHFTLDKSMAGPDHLASLEPQELLSYVQSIRAIEAAMGNGIKQPQPCEWDTRLAARQSLIVTVDKKQGERWQFTDFSTQRVGSGVSPNSIWDLVGTIAEKDYLTGCPL